MSGFINRYLFQNALLRYCYWLLRSPFSAFAAYASAKEKVARSLRTNGEFQILAGPFKGMKYLKHGTSIALNCLAGTYEMEIWPFIDQVSKKKYDLLIDVGCAEGYYACGLAKIMNTPMRAYDISKIAQQDCVETARLNNLSEKVSVFGLLSNQELEELCSRNKVLIFCDIEGFELQLLDMKSVPSLAKADIILESHLVNGEMTGPVIHERLKKTHVCEIVEMQSRNFDDLVDKQGSTRLESLQRIPEDFQAFVTSETRQVNNWWLFRSLS